MTTIEKKIHAAIDAGAHLDTIAELYADAKGSSWRIYTKIQWQQLEAHLRDKLGDEGFAYVVKKSNERIEEAL